MEVNFNQLDILLRLIQERQEDVRVMIVITQQVITNQKTFDVEFNQIQQSLRQMGFKVIAIKKHDKPRQDEENKILEYLQKITSLNLPERLYIYKFCQTVIKLFKPEMQIIRFNQKDTKDLLLMFKQYFMAENNIEILQQIQSYMDQEFKMNIAINLIKILINKSREEFHNLIQSTSSLVISKIKAKLSEQQQQQQKINKSIDQDQANQTTTESPNIKPSVQRRNIKIKEQQLNPQISLRPTIIFRSVSMVDKILIAQAQQQSYQQQQQQQQQQLYLNPERELKLQLRQQQKKLKKKIQHNYKVIADFDCDNYWAIHIILKKKFFKHSNKYCIILKKQKIVLQRGGFYIWSQLQQYNQYIRNTLSSYQLKRVDQIQADKLPNESIMEIHRFYNTTCQSPRKQQQQQQQQQQQLPGIQLKSQSPQITKQNQFIANLSFLPQLQSRNSHQSQQQQQQQQQSKPQSFYDPNKDIITYAQRSFKSLNLSQDNPRHKRSEHNSEIPLYK